MCVKVTIRPKGRRRGRQGRWSSSWVHWLHALTCLPLHHAAFSQRSPSLVTGGAERFPQQHRSQVQHHPEQTGSAEQAVCSQRLPRSGEKANSATLRYLAPLHYLCRSLITGCWSPQQKLFVPDVGQPEADVKSQCSSDATLTNGLSEKPLHVSKNLLHGALCSSLLQLLRNTFVMQHTSRRSRTLIT